MTRWGTAAFILLSIEFAVAELTDLYAEPFGLEARAEVPIFLSFTTGAEPEYSQAKLDDDESVRMMISIQFTVQCRPEIEPCYYVTIGQNMNCKKVIESPGLPPISKCVNGPFGILTLELGGTLESNTQYNLLVLSTLPPEGKRIQSMVVRTLAAIKYLDVTGLPAIEEKTWFMDPELVTEAQSKKQITGLELVTPTVIYQGTLLQEYVFRVTGSSVAFEKGDQLRIFASPAMYPDEGLSFGGACSGFDSMGFASPLLDCSCVVESVPRIDARVGFNVITLTFGSSATLADKPQYFRIALNTPKHVGSIGDWYIASRNVYVLSDSPVYNKVIRAVGPFFIKPEVRSWISMIAPRTSLGAYQSFTVTFYPRVNIIGETIGSPRFFLLSPTFHEITMCRVDASMPHVDLVHPGAEAAFCRLSYVDNMNTYSHQSVTVLVGVENPSFAAPAESWHISFESGDGSLSYDHEFQGWPVYAPLRDAYIMAMTMEYGQKNELDVFFRPASSSPSEARVVIAAPKGFLFEEPCAFDVITGFPETGVFCSNPLSDLGKTLFALRLPMLTAFEGGRFYACSIFPLRNPFPGSYSGALDAENWRIDILSIDGSEVLETTSNVPMGPNLGGLITYPRSLSQAVVTPEIRVPGATGEISIQFRLAAHIGTHGERMRLSAPHGFRWKIGSDVYVRAEGQQWPVAQIVYDLTRPPVAPPHNQLEVSFVDPDIPLGSDVMVSGTMINAPVDPLLNTDVMSANRWIIEMYEPGAGYTKFRFRHQAVVVHGFDLGAVTAGSFTPWLSFSQQTQSPVMVTFRLGTVVRKSSSERLMIQFKTPDRFYVPKDCAAQRISALHLEMHGYTFPPEGAIQSCHGGGEEGIIGRERYAEVDFTTGTVLARRTIYAFTIELVIPDSLPLDNTWEIRVFSGTQVGEEQTGIPGFRLSIEFLSVIYHPGTEDTGEDLRSGATDNKVMFSVQPSTAVLAGGVLRITSPYRFQFARECHNNIFPAKHILSAVGAVSNLYSDFPPVVRCTGTQNRADLVFQQDLDVAVRYTFRVSIINPLLPHPAEWPFTQDVWIFESFDDIGGPLNAAEVRAFYLWTFARATVSPLVLGAGEVARVTIDIEPSLTVPPRGFLSIAAPVGFVIPVPCDGFVRNMFSTGEGFFPLPDQTMCARGAGGRQVVELRLDAMSYLAASRAFRFQISVLHPSQPTALRTRGEGWSISSAEVTSIGESFLERNPAVPGYPVHAPLKVFKVTPQSHRAERAVPVTFVVSLHQSTGTFEVVTTTQASFLVVEMPRFFSIPVQTSGVEIATDAGTMWPCSSFSRVYPPEENYFPADEGGCYAASGASSFRLRLQRNLLVGPDYTFTVDVRHPRITSLTQRQLSQVNVWQASLVRAINMEDVAYCTGSVVGYRVLPALQDVTLRSSATALSVGASSRVSLSFRVISSLDALTNGRLQVALPPSISSASGNASVAGVLCQLWVARQLQEPSRFDCKANGSFLRVDLLSGTIPEEAEVQLDFVVLAGNEVLPDGAENNRWSVSSVRDVSDVLDETLDIPGFTVYSSLKDARIIPQDVSAMSYRNHAEFRLELPMSVDPGASIILNAPDGFVLFPLTYRPTDLPRAEGKKLSTAVQGSSASVAVIWLPQSLAASTPYSFHLTVGNPAVSPPSNDWAIEVRSEENETLSVDTRISGFVVESTFNTSHIESQVDEPLAENYVHFTIAVSQRLVADSILERSTCVPTVDEPICPTRQGLATFLVVVAPQEFVFQPTCGYWVLSRVGSRYHGLPPGSLCRVDPVHANIARVQVSLSLEPLRTYEFTLQVRNAIGVPLYNFWEIRAMQDGVVRERNATITGFPLRQLAFVRMTPSTTLAGVVDNTVTIQMRSVRPLSRGAVIIVAAPEGFFLDPDSSTTSFSLPPTVRLQEPNVIRYQISQQDFLAPHTYFFVSARTRNPSKTPNPNFWYFYIQSQYREHIDLRKHFNGFAIAHKMLYCQVYPNTVPWNFGATTDVSIFFVTKFFVFTKEAKYNDLLPENVGKPPNWVVTLVAPSGFTFPTDNKYSHQCSNFKRWGGKDSYEQIPELQVNSLRCIVRSKRSISIDVPPTLINQTRYSFRLAVQAALTRKDVAMQEMWKLTILESGQILHLGESESPLLEQYYEAEWFYAPTSLNPTLSQT